MTIRVTPPDRDRSLPVALGLRKHPIAHVIPCLSRSERQRLNSSLEENGYCGEEIVLLDGQILDGDGRYRACLETGAMPRFRPFNPTTDGDPFDFVVRKNLAQSWLRKFGQ
ncbi:hypothetical protein HAP48_0001405 (plasmid) [Bradyrhizobium septentrionale]|uniref:Uncharacterized protein n=1 Tax=Bradyrhizobium septentrionale TaxID=1404411 RepID=A0A973WAH5_9BRAD|nr:hypothetical protein [Bradyrhizobium septentrionale]UGY12027.1 hypothetical protein HAP48_0001405 [Bradyrhizobium septentrionale]